jgi:hypothetical protein
MATGERPVDEKFSHAEVGYQYPSEHFGEACGDCAHVIEAASGTRCQAVASPIQLNAWCERFEHK